MIFLLKFPVSLTWKGTSSGKIMASRRFSHQSSGICWAEPASAASLASKEARACVKARARCAWIDVFDCLSDYVKLIFLSIWDFLDVEKYMHMYMYMYIYLQKMCVCVRHYRSMLGVQSLQQPHNPHERFPKEKCVIPADVHRWRQEFAVHKLNNPLSLPSLTLSRQAKSRCLHLSPIWFGTKTVQNSKLKMFFLLVKSLEITRWCPYTNFLEVFNAQKLFTTPRLSVSGSKFNHFLKFPHFPW